MLCWVTGRRLSAREKSLKEVEDEVGRVRWGHIVFECQPSAFGFYPKNNGESVTWNGMTKVFIKVFDSDVCWMDWRCRMVWRRVRV